MAFCNDTLQLLYYSLSQTVDKKLQEKTGGNGAVAHNLWWRRGQRERKMHISALPLVIMPHFSAWNERPLVAPLRTGETRDCERLITASSLSPSSVGFPCLFKRRQRGVFVPKHVPRCLNTVQYNGPKLDVQASGQAAHFHSQHQEQVTDRLCSSAPAEEKEEGEEKHLKVLKFLKTPDVIHKHLPHGSSLALSEQRRCVKCQY